MLEEVASVAVSDLPVLILGESGTGKELVAQGVHALSGRTGEFVAINCSAVPEAMLEGEFFGYMRGAFTNAVADKPGLFEVAHEGTVFLDEIGEMSLDLQSKLLRFLETGTLRRVGATRDTQVETRIVAATNRERSAACRGATDSAAISTTASRTRCTSCRRCVSAATTSSCCSITSSRCSAGRTTASCG